MLLWGTDMTSAPHNYCDWLMCLFAGRMFGKIDLDLKNKRFAFSTRDIRVLCGFTNNINSSSKKYIFVWINHVEKSLLLCNGLQSVRRANEEEEYPVVSEGGS